MSFTPTFAVDVLQHLVGEANLTAIAGQFVGLGTGAGDIEGAADNAAAITAAAEVSGNGYARVDIGSGVLGTVQFGDPASVTNSVAAITFPAASGGDWGTVTRWLLFDAVTAGTLLVFADLTNSRAILDGDTATIPTSQFTITLD